MNNSPDHDEYAELMSMLAQAFAAGDPTPTTLVDEHHSFVRWAALDADLGILLDEQLAGVRDATATGQLIQFADLRVDIDISPDSIAGTVEPWSGGMVALEHPTGIIDARADEHGDFYVDEIPVGPVRLRLTTPDGVKVSEWFAARYRHSS